MSDRWKWLLAAGVACLLAAAVPLTWVDAAETGPGEATRQASYSQASLLGVDVELDGEGYPVVTLITDTTVDFESFVLDGPDRLVLDLSGSICRLDNYRQVVGESGLAQVRAAQHTLEPSATTRVVFDLEDSLTYSILPIGSRIKISFGPAGESYASLVEKREAREAEALAAATPAAVETSTEDVATVADAGVTLDQIRREMESRMPVAEQATEVPAPAEDEADEAVTTVAESAAPAEAAGDDAETTDSRAVDADVIDRLLSTPSLAAPQQSGGGTQYGSVPKSFQTRTIVTDETVYSGRPISLNLVDADIKQVFRLFHEISGLNFVLDPGVGGRVTIVLDQVPWDQALDIILKNNSLDKVLDNNVLRIASTSKLADEAASRRELREAQELEVEPITLTRTLSYAKALEVERVIQNSGILSPRGRVIVDERTNTLIISDVPKKVEPIDSLVSTLDAETPQVMIEARIVETSRQYVRDLGVVWGAQAIADASRGTATSLAFPHNASLRYGLNLPGNGGASTLAFSLANVVDSFTLDVALNALETEGHGRILSSPKVATQNNERAEIEQGVRIPIVNTTATEINVEFVSASLRLIVTPQITAEGTIILDVEVENNSPDFVNTSGDVPSIRTQRAQTKVLINDGGTTVIGGIFTVNEGQSEVGVPWFRKIPIFGWLFRTQNITNENRELLIFITPKIVRLT